MSTRKTRQVRAKLEKKDDEVACSQCQTLQKALTEAKEDVNMLKEKCVDLDNVLERQTDAQQKQLDKLQKDNDKLQKEIDNLQQENDKLQKENDKLQKKNNELKEESDDLKKQNDLSTKLSKAIPLIKALNKNLTDSESKYEMKNSDSEEGETDTETYSKSDASDMEDEESKSENDSELSGAALLKDCYKYSESSNEVTLLMPGRNVYVLKEWKENTLKKRPDAPTAPAVAKQTMAEVFHRNFLEACKSPKDFPEESLKAISEFVSEYQKKQRFQKVVVESEIYKCLYHRIYRIRTQAKARKRKMKQCSKKKQSKKLKK